MSDLFHEQIPDEYVARVFEVMADTPQHTYQVLTKRAERLATWPGPWPANVWAGVSIENAKNLDRLVLLRRCGAQTRFLSCEPLLGPLGPLDLSGIGWVIVGGESGRHMGSEPERWMRPEWAREIRDACVAQRVAYFYKQDSGPRTEMRPWLVEEDGSRWEWHQYPGAMEPPRLIA